MTVEITFETHSTGVDNEAGIASGWRDVALSPTDRLQARELGKRHCGSPLTRSSAPTSAVPVETAEIAFPEGVQILPDHRLRESDYGSMTGAPPEEIDADRLNRIESPFPEGESLRDVVSRVADFLDDVARNWDGKQVVVIGHRATLLAFEHLLGGVPLQGAAAAPFRWQPGWRYVLKT